MKFNRRIVATHAVSQVKIATEVSSLLPHLAEKAKKRLKQEAPQRKHRLGYWTTCPICSGPKSPRSRYCRKCYLAGAKARKRQTISQQQPRSLDSSYHTHTGGRLRISHPNKPVEFRQ